MSKDGKGTLTKEEAISILEVKYRFAETMIELLKGGHVLADLDDDGEICFCLTPHGENTAHALIALDQGYASQ